ncbi:PEP-CTERM sorting domain-containing protein [Rubritalea tangerina]|uniref:PEP-CTERM sorting domain-containing protein n=1 Tax=Rubritalea tangerina TaxID=430798 RepID=A0ABW4ZBY2_9BACT
MIRTITTVAASVALAASAQAATFIFDNNDLANNTITLSDGLYTNSMIVDGVTLVMTVRAESNFTGASVPSGGAAPDAFVGSVGNGIGAAGSGTGKDAQTLTTQSAGSNGAPALEQGVESLFISFDLDVDLVEWYVGNAGAGELSTMRFGVATDSHTGGGAGTFTNITELMAGEELEFTAGLGNTISLGSALGMIQVEAVAVPEPGATALLGLGGLALILRRRK